MAQNDAYVLVGAAVVSISDYVTAGGAGTFTEVGHTKGGVTITPSFENFETKSDQAYGVIKSTPMDFSLTVKVPMLETPPERLRQVLNQPAANLSGTSPNLTLLIGKPEERYHQIKIETVGTGTTGKRTITFWKCRVQSVGEIKFAKDGEQMLDVVFIVQYDSSVTTEDRFGRIVES